MEEDKSEVNGDGCQQPNVIGNAADQPDFDEEPVRMGARSNLSANSVPIRDATNTFPMPQASSSPSAFQFQFGQG